MGLKSVYLRQKSGSEVGQVPHQTPSDAPSADGDERESVGAPGTLDPFGTFLDPSLTCEKKLGRKRLK